MLAFLNPGDEVVLPDPSRVHYAQCIRLANATPVRIPLRIENSFALDPAELYCALTPRTRMIILNSPHNPTGAVLDEEVLCEIAKIASARNLLVLSDEIYEKITFDGAVHHSIASIPGMEDRFLLVNGFSKAYSMTGWRIGYIGASRRLVETLLHVHQYVATCATSFAQAGAFAAYSGEQDCVRDMVGEFRRRRERLVGGLAEIEQLQLVPPQGAFYVFPKFRRLSEPVDLMASRILRETGVSTVPGTAFGANGEGHIRLAFCIPLERIDMAIERLREYLHRHF